MNSDQTFGIILKQNSKIKNGKPVYIQISITYTTAGSEQRTRVFNYAFAVTKKLRNIFTK